MFWLPPLFSSTHNYLGTSVSGSVLGKKYHIQRFLRWGRVFCAAEWLFCFREELVTFRNNMENAAKLTEKVKQKSWWVMYLLEMTRHVRWNSEINWKFQMSTPWHFSLWEINAFKLLFEFSVMKYTKLNQKMCNRNNNKKLYKIRRIKFLIS